MEHPKLVQAFTYKDEYFRIEFYSNQYICTWRTPTMPYPVVMVPRFNTFEEAKDYIDRVICDRKPHI